MLMKWVFWASGTILIAGSLALLVWALLQDRSSVRRRWPWALTSLIALIVGVIVAVQPKVRDDGWASIMPATVLVAMLRLDNNEWVVDAIHDRIHGPMEEEYSHGFIVTHQPFIEDAFFDWQWNWLARSLLNRIHVEGDVERRIRSLRFLIRIRDVVDDSHRDQIYAAIETMIDAPNDDLRIAVSRLYVRPEDPEWSVRIYRALLDDPHEHVRASAVYSLYYLRNHDFDTTTLEDILIKPLGDPSPEVRNAALSTIVSVFRERAEKSERVRQQLEILADDDDDSVRSFRVRVLASLQAEKEAWQMLIRAMQSEDTAVRHGAFTAAMSQETSPPDDIIPLLIEGLSDADRENRWAANHMLEHVDTTHIARYRAAIESLLESEHADARNSAERLLLRLE